MSWSLPSDEELRSLSDADILKLAQRVFAERGRREILRDQERSLR